MHEQFTVILDETQFAESVHEEIHARAGGADHFREGRLIDVGDYYLGPVFFPEAGENQEGACQSFLTRIE
jgi:hypothetical protein